MPSVRFVLVQPDSITVAKNNGSTFIVNRAQIAAGTLAGPLSGIETAVNALLATQMGADGTMLVHVTQANPTLLWNTICLTVGVSAPATWWTNT